MPATVDDFIKNFRGAGAVDDQQASQYFDRFASTRPEDREFDNQALHQGATEYCSERVLTGSASAAIGVAGGTDRRFGRTRTQHRIVRESARA